MYALSTNKTSYNQTCSKCLSYWTTSIADNLSVYEEPHNWFGVLQASDPNAAKPTIVWSGVGTGIFSGYGGSATASSIPFPQATVFNDPTVQYDVLVAGSSGTGETVGINEHGNDGGAVR